MSGPVAREEYSIRIFDKLADAGVTLFSYVPDFGNAEIINLAEEDNRTTVVLLSSEQEGVALSAGADLVNGRAVLLMQSSGVGNCVNMLSLVKAGRFPLLMIGTMRGDYGEQNPWQYPMGEAVEPLFKAMGVLVFKIEHRDDIEKATLAALRASGAGAQSAAIVLSQKFLGAKGF